MAKQQSFADKAKGKKKQDFIMVKVVKSVGTNKGTFKFNERFVKLSDISKITEVN
jgi:hypothetical protein